MNRKISILMFLVVSVSVTGGVAVGQADPEESSATVEAAPANAAPEDERDPAPDKETDKGREPRQRLPEIMVIGLKKDSGVPKVPLGSIGSRDVFGPDQVRETGARDMNDLVQNMPAISTRPYNGGESSAPSFSMRGLPDDGLTEYVNVLIDGVPANPMPYGWTAFSFLPITTERVYAVDYIRGAQSIRYSPNTVSGALNFITQPIPSEPEFQMRSTFGNYDYVSSLVSAGGTYGDFGAIATYVDRRGDGYRKDGDFDQQEFNIKFRIDRGEGSWTAFSFNYMEDEHQSPGGLTKAQFDQDRFGNARPEGRFDGWRTLADVVWHEDIEEGWFEAYSYYSETGRRLDARRPRFGAPATMSYWEDESYFAALGLRASHDAELLGTTHTFFGGVRYQRDWLPSWTIDSEPFGGGASTRLQDSEYDLHALSVHLDDTFQPIEDLTVQLGARVEHVPKADAEDDITGIDRDHEFTEVLPGVGASYLLNEKLAIFANYFEGFRAPQAWAWLGTPGNNDLDFEKGRSAELGTRFENIWAGFTGSATLWRTQYDDFITYDKGFPDNIGEIRTDGVDFILEWDLAEVEETLDGFSLYGAWTIQDSELRSGPDKGNDVPYAWDNKASWRARYEKDMWRASLGGVKVGSSFSDTANTNATSADGQIGKNSGWTLWDAQVSRSVLVGETGRLTAAVGATNLFDREWEVHSRGGYFGGGLVAGAPRQYYVSIGLTVLF